MAAYEISFGGVDLNDGSAYRVLRSTPIRAAGPVLQHSELAAREGAIVTDTRHPSRMIDLSGVVQAADFDTLEDNRDALVRALSNGVQALKLGYQDERYWNARLVGEVEQERLGGPRAWFWKARLLAADPFAYAAAATTTNDNNALSNIAGSLYKKAIAVTVGGNIYSRPTLTITVPSGGPYGMTRIAVINATVSPTEALTVLRTWAADEVLVINCDTFSVTVDGVEVNYAGNFPVFDRRAGTTNSIEVHATASSTPTLNCSFVHTPRWSN